MDFNRELFEKTTVKQIHCNIKVELNSCDEGGVICRKIYQIKCSVFSDFHEKSSFTSVTQ